MFAYLEQLTFEFQFESKQACLLENTRFHPEEVDNDPAFSAALARLCDVFVCDAFGVVHRDQASVTVRLVITILVRSG